MNYLPKKRRLMTELNLVPYIDVMLVLLVIFMVTMPLLTQGIHVKLPQGQASPLPSAQKPIMITVDQLGRYYLGDDSLSSEQLRMRIATALQDNAKQPIFIKGDQGTTYNTVMKVMLIAKQSGAENLNLVTTENMEK